MTMIKRMFLYGSGGAAICGGVAVVVGASAPTIAAATISGACIGVQAACTHEVAKDAFEFKEWQTEKQRRKSENNSR